jgi:hypothetical protein
MEVSRQQADAMEEWGKEMGRIMTTVARMCAGDKVPPSDEKKVQEYDPDLYLKAKHAQAMMAYMKEKQKEYESLWSEEEEEVTYDPQGKADNAEAAVPLKDIPLEASAPAGGEGAVATEGEV